jgi:hypothetical protein
MDVDSTEHVISPPHSLKLHANLMDIVSDKDGLTQAIMHSPKLHVKLKPTRDVIFSMSAMNSKHQNVLKPHVSPKEDASTTHTLNQNVFLNQHQSPQELALITLSGMTTSVHQTQSLLKLLAPPLKENGSQFQPTKIHACPTNHVKMTSLKNGPTDQKMNVKNVQDLLNLGSNGLNHSGYHQPSFNHNIGRPLSMSPKTNG